MLQMQTPAPVPLHRELADAILRREGNFLDEIVDEVASVRKVPREDIMSDRRPKEATLARQIVMWLGKEIADKSYPEIGHFLSRNHATVIHGKRLIDKLRSEAHGDDNVRAHINLLVSRLAPRARELAALAY